MKASHVMAVPCGDTWTGEPKLVGEADTREEAIAVVKAIYGDRVIIEGEGGTVDFYDNDDAPGVFGSPQDGRGAWGVTYIAD